MRTMISAFTRRARMIAIGPMAMGLMALVAWPGDEASAQGGPVKVVSHRYPALEYYAKKMESALPGVPVDAQLMPFDKANELATITFAAKSDAIDLVYANDSTILTYAKNGWVEPLDELWAKYRAEFNLDDFPKDVLDTFSYQGKLYLVPYTSNSQFLFYRTDLFKEKGLQPPTTMDAYLKAAQAFHSPQRSGTILCLKPVDAALNEIHFYMNATGAAWFDDKFKPLFNNEAGVRAIETLKSMSRFAQRGFTSAANDECSIALQQDGVAMGMQWLTRAASMDDPTKSRVVGKIDWVAPPSGGQRIAGDGYAISKFSSKNRDLLFRLMLTVTSPENMRGAASFVMPPRRSLMLDAELAKANRHYPAALASFEVGKPLPRLPELYEVGEGITRRVLQAVTGEMPVKAALDLAARETEEALTKRGYYK